MGQSVVGIRSIEIEMAAPERAAEFYTGVWNLAEVERAGGAILLRATGPWHHVLAIHGNSGPPAVRRIVFTAEGREQCDALHGKVAAATSLVEDPGPVALGGGGYGFGFTDPAGRAFAVVCDAADHRDAGPVPDRPLKISHVNLNDPDPDRTRDFFVDALGFRWVDHSGPQYFLNCASPDHSTIVICRAGQPTLNHVAFEMTDLDSVMRGAGRMRDNGYPIEWGVGRHGPGNNAFAYFAGPEELPIEYTADGRRIDDAYEFHGPDHWKWPPGRLDQWGVTPPHTNRWKRVQTLFGFAPDAWRVRQAD